MRRLLVILLVGSLLAGAWYLTDTRAGGVSGRGIKVGSSESGSLTNNDAKLRNRGPYQVWTVRGKRGQRVVIDMTSSTFDSYLIVRGPDGFVLGSDDDGGGSSNARLRTIFPRTGPYTIVAGSFGPDMRGDYQLTISDWIVPEAPEPGTVQSLAMGDSKDGLLEPGDELTGDGPYQDRWTFELADSARFRVEMRSSDLDSYLMLLDPDGATIATNDDGSGRDAAIAMRVGRGGRYTALATTYGDQPRMGTYRISLAEVTGEVGAPVDLTQAAPKDGSLDVGDSTTSTGSYVDVYLFRAPATRAYQIDLASTTLDMYLTLQDSLGTTLATDDDGGDEGLNSRLRFLLQEGRVYRIGAGTFGGSGRTGPYRISVNPAP